MKEKKAIRRENQVARDALSSDERRHLSAKIRDRLFALPMVVDARKIMLFLAFGSEVDTWLILDQAVVLGKEVVAPVCMPESKGLALYPISSRDEARPGHWGILEPKQVGEPVSPSTIDVVIVPGIAFDLQGNRVGYGGGYYDRFLSQVAKAWKIGVCYDLQLLCRVPREEHDVSVDALVTESKTIIWRGQMD
jgi:5-formyltetrahydrofolate cyclo-ligase